VKTRVTDGVPVGGLERMLEELEAHGEAAGEE